MDFDKLVDVTNGMPGSGKLEGKTVYPPKRSRPVGYTSRKNEGRASVVNGYEGETGAWVTLFDKARQATVVVRPSQVSA